VEKFPKFSWCCDGCNHGGVAIGKTPLSAIVAHTAVAPKCLAFIFIVLIVGSNGKDMT